MSSAGTPRSQTPCARLTPFTRSHSIVITRISACVMCSVRWLNAKRLSLIESTGDLHDVLDFIICNLHAHGQRAHFAADGFSYRESSVFEFECLMFVIRFAEL